ncbi:hypothetical protein SAMN05443292_0657 [Halpernia frigidisoli]|uniref:Uncharacterized protein n=1 Tax=Halpernia frigidisoli TaxID=1125876 RepID=A0A1I3DRE5_9FLAO|nr:hypothetical protein SAMN05443292_0657 [Halpernia frigidisoli]
MDFYFAILEFIVFLAFSLWVLKIFKKDNYFYLKFFGYIILSFLFMLTSPELMRELNVKNYFFENPLVLIVGPIYWLIFLIVIIYGIIRKIKFIKKSKI